MTQPLYDLQSAKQKMHLTEVKMPSDAERLKLYQDSFQSSPLEPKRIKPEDPSQTYIAAVKQQIDGFTAKVQKSASMFFRRDDQGLTASIGSVTFDLILSEDHDLTATVCTHPVQNGEAVSDHIQPQLPSGRIQVLVTNYSIKDAPGGWRQGTYTDGNRALAAYETFKAIFKARVLVTIVTVMEVYDNVALTHVSAPRDSSTGDALVFDVQFQQLRTVQLKVLKLSGVAKPADMKSNKNRQASSRLSAGQATPDEGDMDASSEEGF